MADVDATGQLVGTKGNVIPLFNAAMTEASQEEIKSDSNFIGSAVSAGTYGDQLPQGFAVAAAGITAENDVSYAFVRSAGAIKLALAVGGTGLAGAGLPSPVPYPKQLAAGDQVIVMAQASATREVSLSVATSNGEYHVFAVTPSGSGEHELISVTTGQGIGTTLQGRNLTFAFSMGGANNSYFTSPIYILNGSGVPTGSVTPTDAATGPGVFQRCNSRIELNSRAVFRTDG